MEILVISDNKNSLLESISKIGFWLKAKAGLGSKPKTY